MTANTLLELKQSHSRVSETERRELSGIHIRRGQERAAWKKETARRLADMVAGRQVGVAALRARLG